MPMVRRQNGRSYNIITRTYNTTWRLVRGKSSRAATNRPHPVLPGEAAIQKLTADA
jgi:hypothetical protein